MSTDPGPLATPRPFEYFDLVLEDFDAGRATRHAHLGHWDDPSRPPSTLAEIHVAQHRMAELLVGRLELGDGLRLLDVGCGLGGSIELVGEQDLDVHAIGINIDARQLDRCRTLVPRPSGRVDWLRADGVRLPLAADSVDRLLCLEALPHFSSRAGFFAEAGRVLRPGGIAVITDLLVAPGAAEALGLEPDALAQRFEDVLGPWPEALTGLADVLALAGRAGLRCTSATDATAATAPSHALSFEGVDLDEPGRWGAVLQAEQLFAWLHERSLLEYHYLVFVVDS